MKNLGDFLSSTERHRCQMLEKSSRGNKLNVKVLCQGIIQDSVWLWTAWSDCSCKSCRPDQKGNVSIDAIYGSGASSRMLSTACSDLLDVSSFWLGPIDVKGQICLFLTGEIMELDAYFLQLILYLGMMWWQSIWDVDQVDLQENLCFQWDLWMDCSAKVLCSGGLQPAL